MMKSTENEKQKGEDIEELLPWCIPQRWILTLCLFFGVMLSYSLRVNLSVAIVCMVKTPNTTDNGVPGNETLRPGNGTLHPDSGECVDTLGTDDNLQEHAEFDWSRTTVSSVLASFYYGYIWSQIPGGFLSDKYGGRRVLGVTMMIGSFCTLLLPVCARLSVYLLYLLRIIIGLNSGVVLPAVQSLVGRWAPLKEKSRMIAFVFSGKDVGNVVTLVISGILCHYGFDNGWGSIFYVTGGVSLIWLLFMFHSTADTPRKHRRISQVEIKHIESCIHFDVNAKTNSVPWRLVLSSRAVWVNVFNYIAMDWTAVTLLTSFPIFLKEILHFDIKSNGAVSSIPFACQAISSAFAGPVADLLISKKWLSLINTRKLFQITSSLGTAVFLILAGYMTCDSIYMPIIQVSLAFAFHGLTGVGCLVNFLDIAPRYAGLLFGFANTISNIVAIGAPYVSGLVTQNKAKEEWRMVFVICACTNVVAGLLFAVCATGEIQTWAMTNDSKSPSAEKQSKKKEETADKSIYVTSC